MKNHKLFSFCSGICIFLLACLFAYNLLLAHCDTLDGPVVKACKDALEKNNPNLVLIWVQPKDESTIIEAFNKTMSVRNLGTQAKELADMSFFETVVRIHRTGEGASYTGLKPAGTDNGPAIPEGDKALETGNTNAVQKLIVQTIEENLNKHYNEVIEKKNYNPNDVTAGREYVKAYVEYIHYVEGLYDAAKNPVEGHSTETGEIKHIEN